MGPISAETAIDAPRERVFEALSDLSLRPTFCGHFMRDYRLARLPASGRGAAARFRIPRLLGPMWMDTAIAEAERPHLVSERGRGGRSNRTRAATAWELTEGGAGATTVKLTFWLEPETRLDRLHLLGAGAWYRRKWRHALARLKEQIEGGEAPERVRLAGADRVAGAAG